MERSARRFRDAWSKNRLAPDGEGLIYTFHAPLHRAACEAAQGERPRPDWASVSGATWGCRSPTSAGRFRIDGDAAENGLDPRRDRAATVSRPVRRRRA